MKELVQLKPKTVRWDQVFLDPQNPRLAEIELGEVRTPLPDGQVVDARVQADLLDRLRNDIGIDDLVQKISKLGFLTIDRIVVRPLVGIDNSFVVLEGNRRVAALRYMQDSPLMLATLSPDVKSTLAQFEVLVYEGGNDQIAWDLQGVRHMGGLKVWGPYQQARFLVGLKQREDVSPTDLAQISGLAAQRLAGSFVPTTASCKLLRTRTGEIRSTSRTSVCSRRPSSIATRVRFLCGLTGVRIRSVSRMRTD